MLFDCDHQVGGAAIMQKEESLAESPERRGPEFISHRFPLRYTILKIFSHLVNGQVGEKIGGFSSEGGNSRIGIRGERRGVTQVASDLREQGLAFRDRRGAARCGGGRRRRRQESHESGAGFAITQNREGLGWSGRICAVVGRGCGSGKNTAFFALGLEKLV